MAMPTPAERLDDIFERIVRGVPLESWHRDWVFCARRRWKQGASLDAAFHLKHGRGDRHSGKALSQDERDTAIRVVALALADEKSVSAKASEITRIVRVGEKPPAEIQDEVDLLRQVGIPGERQLRRLVDAATKSQVGHQTRVLCPTSTLSNYRSQS